ncbi:MAG: D-alanyl-D-alanine carboxypeptidase family protein [Cyanobacteria bacterium P01_A01_bin.116]
MLNINQILEDNELTQIFAGLDRTQYSQLFPEFSKAYTSHFPDAQRREIIEEGSHTLTLASEYNQLFFILFCFRWQPKLPLLSALFGLKQSQASWWVTQLRPVLLKVYRPGWNTGASGQPHGQLHSVDDIIEQFPQAASVLGAGNLASARSREPNFVDYGQKTQHVTVYGSNLINAAKEPAAHTTRLRQVIPIAAVAAAIAIPGLLIVQQSRSSVADTNEPTTTAAQVLKITPVPTRATGSSTNPSSNNARSPTTTLGEENTAVAIAKPLESQPDSAASADQIPEDPAATAVTLPDAIATFNHFYYPEADPSRIVSVGLFVRDSYEREEFLDAEAAQAFETMKAAAAADGVSLIPVSGFRTVAQQQDLFAKQVEKLGSESAAAKLSAPPNHSEHHTGYAIDIGDANVPDADIKYSFEQTDAYRWLQANASDYGFEESFSKGNQQGVSFEPWHWRYTGSERAELTFGVSKTMFP